MTGLSPQITDAVTQSHIKTPAATPALALGSLYQSVAHALGLAAEWIVNEQQQSGITGMAATTEAVMALIAKDVPTQGAPRNDPPVVVQAPDPVASPDAMAATAAMAQTIGQAAGSANGSHEIEALSLAHAPDTTATRTIEQAIEWANKQVIEAAGPWSNAVGDVTKALAGAMRELQAVVKETNLAMVKQAAITAVLVRMIEAPDHLEQYQKILALIEGI